jgi:hypothetical protein
MTKKKLSQKKPELPLKTKSRKPVRKSRTARYPLTNQELEILGAKHKPAATWYEEEELP